MTSAVISICLRDSSRPPSVGRDVGQRGPEREGVEERADVRVRARSAPLLEQGGDGRDDRRTLLVVRGIDVVEHDLGPGRGDGVPDLVGGRDRAAHVQVDAHDVEPGSAPIPCSRRHRIRCWHPAPPPSARARPVAVSSIPRCRSTGAGMPTLTASVPTLARCHIRRQPSTAAEPPPSRSHQTAAPRLPSSRWRGSSSSWSWSWSSARWSPWPVASTCRGRCCWWWPAWR